MDVRKSTAGDEGAKGHRRRCVWRDWVVGSRSAHPPSRARSSSSRGGHSSSLNSSLVGHLDEKWTMVFGQGLVFVGGGARSWKQERREGREERRTQTSLQSLYAWTRYIEEQSQMILQSLVQGKEGRARVRGDVQYAPHWKTRSSLSSVEGLAFLSLVDNGSERTLFLSYRFCSRQSIDWSAANLHGLERVGSSDFSMGGVKRREGRTLCTLMQCPSSINPDR